MTHDVFISYSTKNTEHAEAIYERLEDNGIKCWFAPKNIGTATNFAEEIMLGIKPAKVVVLVFSKDAQESEYVNNEIDAAFKEDKPIVPIKVDDSFPKDQMEFYLSSTQWLDASPTARKKENKTIESCYEQLVVDVQNVLRKLNNDDDEDDDDDNHNIVIPPHHRQSFFEKHKTKIIALIAVLIAACLIFAFVGMNSDSNSEVKNETGVEIGYIGLEDNGGGSYSYYVFGTISDDLTSSSKNVIHIDYYDGDGKVVDSSDTKMNDFDGNILGSIDVSDDNVNKVSLQLQDKDDNVLYNVESNNVINEQ